MSTKRLKIKIHKVQLLMFQAMPRRGGNMPSPLTSRRFVDVAVPSSLRRWLPSAGQTLSTSRPSKRTSGAPWLWTWPRPRSRASRTPPGLTRSSGCSERSLSSISTEKRRWTILLKVVVVVVMLLCLHPNLVKTIFRWEWWGRQWRRSVFAPTLVSSMGRMVLAGTVKCVFKYLSTKYFGLGKIDQNFSSWEKRVFFHSCHHDKFF